MRINLTDRRIAALTADPEGRRRPELRDAVVPGLIVRTAARRKVFALHARFPGAKHPTRRVLGEVGTVTLDAARDTAREWLAQIRKGIDPVAEARRRADDDRRAREAERVQDECRFANVANDYLRRKVAGQRRAREAERIVRNVLVAAWGTRPIGELTRRDVVRLVEAIDDRGAPIYAALVFSHARSLFNWAINRGTYSLEHSPCDRVKVGDLVSRRKQPRQRVLSDDELRCLWKATGRMGYPWQQLFRLICCTGTRKTEAAGARWREFSNLDDPSKAAWQIPPERFKSNATHLVPLSADALDRGAPAFPARRPSVLVQLWRAPGDGAAPGQGAARRADAALRARAGPAARRGPRCGHADAVADPRSASRRSHQTRRVGGQRHGRRNVPRPRSARAATRVRPA